LRNAFTSQSRLARCEAERSSLRGNFNFSTQVVDMHRQSCGRGYRGTVSVKLFFAHHASNSLSLISDALMLNRLWRRIWEYCRLGQRVSRCAEAIAARCANELLRHADERWTAMTQATQCGYLRANAGMIVAKEVTAAIAAEPALAQARAALTEAAIQRVIALAIATGTRSANRLAERRAA
jgi:hypothetical protein